jgi:hypothetical protein
MRPLLSLLLSLALSDSPKSSARPAHRREARRRYPRNRLYVEALEERTVPTAVSVADAAAREGPANLGILDPAGAAALLNGPRGIAFDNAPGTPHYHDLFVTSYRTQSVLRFDWASQTYQPFVAPGSGGLADPYALAFGSDGNLYVTALSQSWVLQFDGTTGSFLSTFVATGSGGLTNASGLAFGPDGDLYVSSCHNHDNETGQVLKYQGPSVGPNGEQPGQFLGIYCSTGIGSQPSELAFGPDGSLYVSCTNNGSGAPNSGFVNRYQGPSGSSPGQFIDTFVPAGRGGAKNPRSPMFDSQGHLYVTDGILNEVLRYQGPNEANPGAFIDTYVTTGQQNGLGPALGLAIGPDGNLYVGSRDSNEITRVAPVAQASFAVTLDSASASPVTVNYATADGTAVAGTDYTQTSGTLTFPAGVTSEGVNVPVTSVAAGGPTKTFTVNLSGASGATISRSQGTGSILNRQTKFFVADSGSSPGTYVYGPSTYEYGSGGTSEEITPETSGDTAPRGVATTAAGTTEWVVDANKSIYVYTNHGVLLGSWAAGGLSSSATLTGIATNGTDIWLVDSSSDKVYRYAGAASRLSGSQSAASSFSLAGGKSGDPNPQDIVTDGTSLWVVDGTKLKVFKYTLSGSLLGSWAIDPADAHPTGIAINPANVSDIWIVDSGTLKVYDYTAAAGRTSGSQGAAATFALNPSDTNPQGLADPPPADTPLTTAAPPVTLGQPSTAAFSLVSGGGVAAASSLAPRDAAFALLARESLSGTPAPGVPAGGALAPRPDSPAPAGPAAGQGLMGPVTLLSPWAGAGTRPEGSDLPDGPLADGTSPAAALATDGIATGTADDAATAP